MNTYIQYEISLSIYLRIYFEYTTTGREYYAGLWISKLFFSLAALLVELYYAGGSW